MNECQILDYITAGSTVVLAGLTAVYVWLTNRLLESQSDPYVILTVMHDRDQPALLKLVARNIGNGLARDITFSFSQPLPANAWNPDDKQEEMTDGPLINGIPALGPGEQRIIDWGTYPVLYEVLKHKPIYVECRFNKNGKPMPSVHSLVEVDSFCSTSANTSPTMRVVSALEKISTNLK